MRLPPAEYLQTWRLTARACTDAVSERRRQGSSWVSTGNLSAAIRECLEHAEDCARRAALQRDSKLRQDFVDLEAAGLSSPVAMKFAGRLDAFFNSVKRSGN
jgi:hypothetical protein